MRRQQRERQRRIPEQIVRCVQHGSVINLRVIDLRSGGVPEKKHLS
jgi:hypothetical protein